MPISKKAYEHLTPEEKKEIVWVNNLRASLDNSIEHLWIRALYILLFGIVVFSISSEEVNQNTVFSYFTIIQGLLLIPLYRVMKKRRRLEYLFVGVMLYVIIWFIEVIFFGLPNDLLSAYNTIQITGSGLKPNVKFLYREANENRDVILIFPYVYTGVKSIFGFFIFNAYRNYYRFRNLNPSLKGKIWE